MEAAAVMDADIALILNLMLEEIQNYKNMIQDILTAPREENQKPKFFLHEEMKAWLADNINLATTVDCVDYKYVASVAYMDQPKFNRYQENVTLPTTFKVSSIPSIDGTSLGFIAHTYMDLTPYAKVIDVLTKRVEELESVRNAEVAQLIANQIVLQNELVELKKKLDEKGTDN